MVILLVAACGGDRTNDAPSAASASLVATSALISFVGRVGDDAGPALYTVATDGSGLRRALPAPAGLKMFGWSAIAPDGASVAVAWRDVGGGTPTPPDSGIVVMRLDGSGRRTLVDDDAIDGQFGDYLNLAWSPDGARLAFTRRTVDPQLRAALYVVDADGGHLRALSDRQERCDQPAWSPDGAQLAYVCGASAGGTPAIEVSAPDGSGRRTLSANDLGDTQPSWSPDGKRIAFTHEIARAHWALDVADADGGDAHQVVDAIEPLYPPRWSPDGAKLAFTSHQNGTGTVIGTALTAVVVGVDGSGARTLAADAGSCSDPRWSPDGARLVMACRDPASAATPMPDALAPLDVVVIAPDGSDERVVVSGVLPDGTPGALPAWVARSP